MTKNAIFLIQKWITHHTKVDYATSLSSFFIFCFVKLMCANKSKDYVNLLLQVSLLYYCCGHQG